MAELADARDLISREIQLSYRFDPGFRHHYIAGWSSPVARRAHNPKVVRFKSHSRNQKNSNHLFGGLSSFFLVAGGACPLRPSGRREWENERKIVNNCFSWSDVSRCEPREPSVPRRRAATQKQTGQEIPLHKWSCLWQMMWATPNDVALLANGL